MDTQILSTRRDVPFWLSVWIYPFGYPRMDMPMRAYASVPWDAPTPMSQTGTPSALHSGIECACPGTMTMGWMHVTHVHAHAWPVDQIAVSIPPET